MVETRCPDCSAPTMSKMASKPRRCDECRLERRRATRAAWLATNGERAKEQVRAWKRAHRDEIRAKARIVVERDMTCERCEAPFTRQGSRGRLPSWCPECRMVRNAEINAACRAREPEKHLAKAKRAGAIRRAAAKDAAAELVMRLEVFERDGWICQLCAEPVDRDLAHPHPQSPSLDHALPLSRGGAHTYANTQLAHLRCNLRKGARVTEGAA